MFVEGCMNSVKQIGMSMKCKNYLGNYYNVLSQLVNFVECRIQFSKWKNKQINQGIPRHYGDFFIGIYLDVPTLAI